MSVQLCSLAMSTFADKLYPGTLNRVGLMHMIRNTAKVAAVALVAAMLAPVAVRATPDLEQKLFDACMRSVMERKELSRIVDIKATFSPNRYFPGNSGMQRKRGEPLPFPVSNIRDGFWFESASTVYVVTSKISGGCLVGIISREPFSTLKVWERMIMSRGLIPFVSPPVTGMPVPEGHTYLADGLQGMEPSELERFVEQRWAHKVREMNGIWNRYNYPSGDPRAATGTKVMVRARKLFRENPDKADREHTFPALEKEALQKIKYPEDFMDAPLATGFVISFISPTQVR